MPSLKSGDGAGSLELGKIVVTLSQGETATLRAVLDLEGFLKLKSLDRSLSVQGSLSDPNSGILVLSVTSNGMPQLAELAAEIGISNFTESLKSVGLNLPVLDQISLGFELLNKKVTQISAKGSMTLGAGELDMTCGLLPAVVIQGGIKASSQITVADLFAGLPLEPSELPNSKLKTLQLVAQPKAKTYKSSFTLENNWEVDLGGATLALAAVNGQIDSVAEAVTAQFSGTVDINGTKLLLTSDYKSNSAIAYGGALPIAFSGKMAPDQSVSLKTLVDKLMGGLVDLPDEVPNLDLTELDLSLTPKTGEFVVNAAAMDPWKIPVGINGLELDDITLNLNRSISENGKKTITGVIGGELEVAGTSFRSDYTFPGNFRLKGAVPSLKLSPVLQDLCGSSILRDIPVPTSVLAVDFSNITVTVAPQSKLFSLSANSPLGTVELMVKKIASQWGFIVGFLPPTSWKFSTIADEPIPLIPKYGNLSLCEKGVSAYGWTFRGIERFGMEVV